MGAAVSRGGGGRIQIPEPGAQPSARISSRVAGSGSCPTPPRPGSCRLHVQVAAVGLVVVLVETVVDTGFRLLASDIFYYVNLEIDGARGARRARGNLDPGPPTPEW